MSDRTESSAVSEFDAGAVLAELRETVEDDLRAFVEYDAQTYNTLFMADRVIAQFGGEDNVEQFADKLHENYRLDFTEKQMYEDVYAELGTVRAFSVFFEENAIFRFVGDSTGLYVSLELDAPFNRVIESVYEVIEEDTADE
jgi:hypothetical protein